MFRSFGHTDWNMSTYYKKKMSPLHSQPSRNTGLLFAHSSECAKHSLVSRAVTEFLTSSSTAVGTKINSVPHPGRHAKQFERTPKVGRFSVGVTRTCLMSLNQSVCFSTPTRWRLCAGAAAHLPSSLATLRSRELWGRGWRDGLAVERVVNRMLFEGCLASWSPFSTSRGLISRKHILNRRSPAAAAALPDFLDVWDGSASVGRCSSPSFHNARLPRQPPSLAGIAPRCLTVLW